MMNAGQVGSRRLRVLRAALAVGILGAVAAASTTGRGAAREDDPALERTRAQVRMLDDLFKVAVVDITNRYPTGQPAVKVAKAIFEAARGKKYFDAKLLDATGAPLGDANVPGDDFERKAAAAMVAGQTYIEEVVGEGDARRLRAATLVPAVLPRCATCHGVKQGDVLGFLSYDVPIR
jgi:hypothetical protein